jgi:hypothetical protein
MNSDVARQLGSLEVMGATLELPSSLPRSSSKLPPNQKCVAGCRCRRHHNGGNRHTPESRAKIAETLRRRTETDPAWREHLRRIAVERWERDRIA